MTARRVLCSSTRKDPSCSSRHPARLLPAPAGFYSAPPGHKGHRHAPRGARRTSSPPRPAPSLPFFPPLRLAAAASLGQTRASPGRIPAATAPRLPRTPAVQVSMGGSAQRRPLPSRMSSPDRVAASGLPDADKSLAAAKTSRRALRRTPGSGEALLRGQIRALLHRVEKHGCAAALDRPACIQALLGVSRPPAQLLAPTPSNSTGDWTRLRGQHVVPSVGEEELLLPKLQDCRSLQLPAATTSGRGEPRRLQTEPGAGVR
ncbi:hypothetical protein BS78_10G078500 [Paspalum vaginatum]|nr:hypothetical protein BS78_10G078500 [Paspalum vaginatum]